MRIVRTYESFRDFDIDFAISKIKHQFSNDIVKKMVDDEINDWIDDDNIDKKKWYKELGSGSIDEVIADQMFDWYESEFTDIKIDDSQKKELIKKIVSTYDVLQH